MTEYCSVLVSKSWEPDTKPDVVTDYAFEDHDGDTGSESTRTCIRGHLTTLGEFSKRLQVKQLQNDSGDNEHCQITLQCKPVYGVSIVGVSVASEARTLEVYDSRDGSYLQTVRGGKDKEDSEADNSRVHFLCRCHLDQPLGAVTVKFLSLGQRVSFEIAHIRVVLQACPPAQSGGLESASQLTINMDRLRQDVHDMGDSVSDRAKAFLTTLENFQKNKHGAVYDLRHLLLDKNAPEGMGQSMDGITTLLSVFASSGSSGKGTQSNPHPGSSSAEGSMINHMLTQMMNSLAVGAGGGGEAGAWGGGGEAEKARMYQFLQSVCGQVSQQRAEEGAHTSAGVNAVQGTDKGSGGEEVLSSAELESRVTAQVEAVMDSRLSEVEKHIKQQVDQRMEELETRMSGKLDAIVALLQSQKQS